MKVNIFSKVITLLSASLFTTGANATTSYFSEGHLSLEVISFTDKFGVIFDLGDQPASIVTSVFDNFKDDAYTASIIGNAYADGVSTPFSDFGLIELDAQASGYSEDSYAYAESDSTAEANFSFKNTSSDDYRINMKLGYSFSGEVETNKPADLQNGLAGIDIDLFGDNSFGQDISISRMASLIDSPFSGVNSIDFSFLLEAGETENAFASIYSYGESESVSAVSEVPLPATIFLMAPGFMGLLFLSKKVSS